MPVFKRVVAFSVLALAIAPFATASTFASRTTKSSSKTCSKGEFYYDRKECCLPSGGPTPSSTHTPTPPSGKSCPPSSWYWDDDQSCCLPKWPTSTPTPTPSSTHHTSTHTSPSSTPTGTPPPQCSSGWDWVDSLLCCTPSPSKPSHTPKPSATPKQGNGNGNGHHYKRAHVARAIPACPKGLDACPISGSLLGDYECLDTSVELESCGGCASTGEGQDCTAIEGAWNVGCDSGSCRVYSCFAGFKLSSDRTSCIAL
ncbi:protein priA [Lentinula aff. detonsa]|uniref:Protein priA n=1 Tax=Lentinula aff. detonsa TaxID=2804958 RepID=A0AA38KAQ0_9AGAR|nr:protein priA [Lentinula aff. detonsa]